VVEEKATTCCYAQSDKQWIADPQGVAWETFFTYGEATVYGRSGVLGTLAEASGGPRDLRLRPGRDRAAEPQAAKASACARLAARKSS